MISWTNESGIVVLIKFKIKDENEKVTVIKVDRVLFSEKEKLAGNIMYLYSCQSIFDNTEKKYELKYDIISCKWMLWKM